MNAGSAFDHANPTFALLLTSRTGEPDEDRTLMPIADPYRQERARYKGKRLSTEDENMWDKLFKANQEANFPPLYLGDTCLSKLPPGTGDR